MGHGTWHTLMELQLCYPFTVRCRHNRPAITVQHNNYMILYAVLQWRRQNMNQISYSHTDVERNIIRKLFLSDVSDLWDRNKILRCGDLPHLHVPDCIWVFFYFVWFVFIHHNFQFCFELCTYCNILDIYLLWNLNYVNYLLFDMKSLNYLFCNMFGSVLECYELTGVSLLWTRRALANKAKIGLLWKKLGFIKEFTLIVF